nr:hypothetical protein [Sinorhizobium fredii]
MAKPGSQRLTQRGKNTPQSLLVDKGVNSNANTIGKIDFDDAGALFQCRPLGRQHRFRPRGRPLCDGIVIAGPSSSPRPNTPIGMKSRVGCDRSIREAGPVTELSGLGCPYPAEKQVAVDPAPARHLRYRIAGKLRFFNNPPFLFQRPVSSTALGCFTHSRHRIPP